MNRVRKYSSFPSGIQAFFWSMLQLEQSIEGKERVVSFDKTSQLSVGIAQLGKVVRGCIEGRRA